MMYIQKMQLKVISDDLVLNPPKPIKKVASTNISVIGGGKLDILEIIRWQNNAQNIHGHTFKFVQQNKDMLLTVTLV